MIHNILIFNIFTKDVYCGISLQYEKPTIQYIKREPWPMYRRNTSAYNECSITDDGQKGETCNIPIESCITGNKYNSDATQHGTTI